MSTTTAAAAAAIYLVHLNPMTNAHESIISTLKKDYRAYIFPVRFIKDGQEVNTKSFPFSYPLRKRMVESVFGDSVAVLPDYTFYAPYNKYMPPLLSSRSWQLRNQIITKINEEGSSHTPETGPSGLCSKHTGSTRSKLTGLKFLHHRSG